MSVRAIAAIGMAMLSVAGSLAQDAEPASLDILVFGATGRVGVHIVDEALSRGHKVTAVSRDPGQIEIEHENLVAVEGDLLDMASIERLLAGRDIVIVSVRGVVGDADDPRNAIQYIAARNIVEVLRTMGEGAARYLHVGGAGTLEVEPGELLADRIIRLFVPKGLEAEIDAQVLVLEYLRTIEDVRWTYATPPRNFTNGDRTGRYRIGGDTMLRDDRGRSRISRADFAVALIDEAEKSAFVRRRFSVAY